MIENFKNEAGKLKCTKNVKKVVISQIVPIDLKFAIDNLPLSKTLKDKSTKLLCLMIQKAINEEKDISAQITLPSKYLEKVFNKHYKDFFNVLQDGKIILSNHFYKASINKTGIAKSYWINDNLTRSEFVKVSYLDSKIKDDGFIKLNRSPFFYKKPEIILNTNDTYNSNSCSYSNSISSNPINSNSNTIHIFPSVFNLNPKSNSKLNIDIINTTISNKDIYNCNSNTIHIFPSVFANELQISSCLDEYYNYLFDLNEFLDPNSVSNIINIYGTDLNFNEDTKIISPLNSNFIKSSNLELNSKLINNLKYNNYIDTYISNSISNTIHIFPSFFVNEINFDPGIQICDNKTLKDNKNFEQKQPSYLNNTK